MSDRPTLIIPMAGAGQRFADAGYRDPKPFIDVCGKTMVERVLDNIRLSDSRVVLLILKEHAERASDFIHFLRRNYGAEIVSVEHKTEGTACTLLLARPYINHGQPLLIANCDQLVDFDCKAFYRDCFDRNLDGSILVFREPDLNPKWSYARVDNAGMVVETREKKAISDFATVGIYLFRHGRDFVNAAIDMIARNERVNHEFYTCPVYNYAIRSGLRVGYCEVPKESMHGLGTPEDLALFHEKFKQGRIPLGLLHDTVPLSVGRGLS